MYPFVGSPLSFGALRFLNGGMGMNSLQALGGNMGQAAPITPTNYTQRPVQAPQMQQAPMMQPQRPMGLLGPRMQQGGHSGGGFGGGMRGGPSIGPGSGGSRSGRF